MIDIKQNTDVWQCLHNITLDMTAIINDKHLWNRHPKFLASLHNPCQNLVYFSCRLGLAVSLSWSFLSWQHVRVTKKHTQDKISFDSFSVLKMPPFISLVCDLSFSTTTAFPADLNVLSRERHTVGDLILLSQPAEVGMALNWCSNRC